MSDQTEPTTDQTAAAQPGAEPPPMSCTPSFADLFRYMDGFLDDGHRADLRSHLEACGCCGEMYHFQTRFRQMVELRCRVDLPPDLPGRVFGAITQPDGPGPSAR
jgi:mycothiol system anti-sigma-R factor